MKRITSLAFLLAISTLAVQAHANGSSQTTGSISLGYAKQLVARAAESKGFWHDYRATIGQPVGPGLRAASAKPYFGKNPHIMTATGGNPSTLVAVPSYVGTVNMVKGKGAPKPGARVTLTPGPFPLNATSP